MVEDSIIPKDKNVYRRVYYPEHPKAYADGRVFQHRLLYEQYHQCCMLEWGIVHHINGVKTDNSIENLLGMTNSQHMRIHGIGKHISEETKRKISESEKGKHHSEEARMKMSKAKKGKVPWIKGKIHSAETRRKLSESHKGQIAWNKGKICGKRSEEIRLKISETMKSKYHS